MAGLIKRGKTYYAVFYLVGREERRSLGTGDYQIAKAKLIDVCRQRKWDRSGRLVKL